MTSASRQILRVTFYLLLFIFLLAFALRIFGYLDKYPGTDEKHTVRIASTFLTPAFYPTLLRDSYPPFFYMLSGLILRLFSSVFALRVFMVLFGLLSLYLFYRILRFYFPQRLCLWTTFLLAIHPLHVIYSQHPRPYIFMMFLVTLSLFLLLSWLRTYHFSYLFFLLLTYLVSFYTHYYMIFVVGIQSLIVFFSVSRRKFFWHYILGLFAVALLCLLWLPSFLRQYNYIITQGATALEPVRLIEIPYPFYKLALMMNLQYMLSYFPILLLSALLIGGLFLYGSYLLFKKRSLITSIFLSHFYGIFLISLIFGFFIPVYSFRYLSYLLPFFIFTVVYATLHLKSTVIQRIILFLLLLTWLFIDFAYFSLMEFRLWTMYFGV